MCFFDGGRDVKTDEMIFKYSKYLGCVSFIHKECVQPFDCI